MAYGSVSLRMTSRSNVTVMSVKYFFVSVRALALIYSLLVTYADAGRCPDGWYGSKCQLQCHCKTVKYCDGITGECVDGLCAPGWFDMGCQYVDWVDKSDAPAWLKDNDDRTCNPSKQNDVIEIKFQKEHVITRYRLVGRIGAAQELYSVNATVLFRGKKELVVVHSHHQEGETTVEFYTEDLHRVIGYRFEGVGILKLCSLYMTTGRNIALKQTATLSSQLMGGEFGSLRKNFEPSDAHFAIDGNTGNRYPSDGCAHSKHDQPYASWTIEFQQPVRIYRMSVHVIEKYTECPWDWGTDRVTGMCHSFGDQRFNYSEGREFCQKHGGDLLAVDSQTEYGYLKFSYNLNRVCYLGATDVESEGKWMWHTGKPVTFFLWKSGQPNEFAESEDCLVTTWEAEWDDLGCYEIHYVCCMTAMGGFPGRMKAFNLLGYDESSSEVFQYQAEKKIKKRYDIYEATPPVKYMQVNTTQEPHLIQLCEFEAYGETECPLGTFGPECTFSCFCANGTLCTPTGWCKSGCAKGYTGPFCQGCPEGYFGLPACKHECNPNCIGVCSYRDGACNEGCLPGYWGETCTRNCSKQCRDSCDTKTGQCPHIIEKLSDEEGISFLLLLILLLLLLLCCLTALCRRQVNKTIIKETVILEKEKPDSPETASARL